MRKFIVAGIAFVLLLAGFIVYMEVDKRKFIDNISAVSAFVDQSVNREETIREVTRANEEPKLQEVDPAELLDTVNRISDQFGYTEAATTYAKLETKRMSGEKLTIDEEVARLEAQLYLYPDEDTRKSLILQRFVQSKGPDFHPRDGFSEEDIAKLRELGIPVVWRGNQMIINPMPDHIREEVDKDFRERYAHILNDPHYFPPRPPAPESISSESIDEDIDFPPARSEGTSVMPETKTPIPSEHVHEEDRHVHETPTLKPPAPTAAKSVEDSGREGLSKVQQELVKQFFDEYGTEEGFRLLREMDSDTAERFERERRGAPSRSSPSSDGYSDEPSPDDSP